MREPELAEHQKRIVALERKLDALATVVRAQQTSLEALAGGLAGHDPVIAALRDEGGLHDQQILALFRAFSELTDAMVSGDDLPAPPSPETARKVHKEIERLRRMFGQGGAGPATGGN